MIIFCIPWKWGVYHCKACSSLCFTMLPYSKTSSRAESLPLWSGGIRIKCSKSGLSSTEQSRYWLIIWNAVMIWLNCDVSSGLCCSAPIISRPYHLRKAIPQLWNWLWLQMRYHCKAKRTCSAMVIQNTSIQNNSNNNGFQNIPNFLWWLY